jgi:CHAD domain-containing protein
VLASLPIKEFAVRQLASRLDRVEKEWNRCAESAGADEIHDLRVSLRRFGETLWLFRRLFPKRERKQVRAELKTALGFAGDTRDVDIAFESFEAAGVKLSPELRLHLESERAIGEAALVATLAVGRRTRVAERWRRALGLHPDLSYDSPPLAEDSLKTDDSPNREQQVTAAEADPEEITPLVEPEPLIDIAEGESLGASDDELIPAVAPEEGVEP